MEEKTKSKENRSVKDKVKKRNYRPRKKKNSQTKESKLEEVRFKKT